MHRANQTPIPLLRAADPVQPQRDPADPQSAQVKKPLPEPPPAQVEQYRAPIPKTVIELQQFRQSMSQPIRSRDGAQGAATLINLNPRINRWFLLRLERAGVPTGTYHLENVAPGRQEIGLSKGLKEGLAIVVGNTTYPCPLWGEDPPGELHQPRTFRDVYAPLCEGRLYLRNPTKGNKTSIEWTTDFLRNYVWGGEWFTTVVRETFYQDAYLTTSEILPGDESPRRRPAGAPARPLIDARYADHYLVPGELGIALEEGNDRVLVGRWYPVRSLPGIFISAVQPGLIAEKIVEAQRDQVNPLDQTEQSALVFLVAFELARFEVEFALGTDHPAVGWSGRVPPALVDASLPGPDGIGSTEPLIRTGKVSPAVARRIAATFVGGFKRYHGAFRYGELASRNQGSHYGFIESGAVLSKLQPGLATVLVWDDGSLELKTWTEEDNADLARIRHARQNGLPLIELDPVLGSPRPGRLVREPRLGNWSGSADGRYRTVRSGVCLQEDADRRFLIYGYFSAATASAMARVFQAYHCSYAMLLDMNALEHTYLAVYRVPASSLEVEQLVKGMSVLEKNSQNQVIPRFVGYADNRDFFYLLRRNAP